MSRNEKEDLITAMSSPWPQMMKTFQGERKVQIERLDSQLDLWGIQQERDRVRNEWLSYHEDNYDRQLEVILKLGNRP